MCAKIILTRCYVVCKFSDSRLRFDCGCRLKTNMGKCTCKLLNFKGFYTCTVLLSQPLWVNSSASKCFFTSISKGWPRETEYLVKTKLVLLHWICCCTYKTRRIEDGEAIVRSTCPCNCGLADFDWQLGFSRSSISFSIFPHLYNRRFLVAKWYGSSCSHPQKLRPSHLLTACFCCGWFKADSLSSFIHIVRTRSTFRSRRCGLKRRNWSSCCVHLRWFFTTCCLRSHRSFSQFSTPDFGIANSELQLVIPQTQQVNLSGTAAPSLRMTEIPGYPLHDNVDWQFRLHPHSEFQVLGIGNCDHSASESNWLRVDIFQFLFMNLKHLSKMIGNISAALNFNRVFLELQYQANLFTHNFFSKSNHMHREMTDNLWA